MKFFKYNKDVGREGISPWREITEDELVGNEVVEQLEGSLYYVDPENEEVLFVLLN